MEIRANQFQRIFGVRLAEFWLGPIGRFDVTRFNDTVIKSGDASVADVVRERFGQEAVQLITELL